MTRLQKGLAPVALQTQSCLGLALSCSLPENPSTQCFRTLVPTATKGMAFWTRVLEHWVVGPSGSFFRRAKTTADLSRPQKLGTEAAARTFNHRWRRDHHSWHCVSAALPDDPFPKVRPGPVAVFGLGARKRWEQARCGPASAWSARVKIVFNAFWLKVDWGLKSAVQGFVRVGSLST